ncbi:MAG: hypothetical protein HZB38_09830 [Planctomycetes bacterium]|nr:hypothetical protein [Planctomycetota bacterium]
MLTVECKVHFEIGRKSRKELEVGDTPPDPETLVEPGRVPRISRLMALAIRLERLVVEGVARDYADLARLGGVTRARLTQIMNLTLLAPDIQEALLFLPRTLRGRNPITEPELRAVAAVPDWRKQRRMWKCPPFDRTAKPVTVPTSGST